MITYEGTKRHQLLGSRRSPLRDFNCYLPDGLIILFYRLCITSALNYMHLYNYVSLLGGSKELWCEKSAKIISKLL